MELNHNKTKETAQSGNTVKIHFTGKRAGGEVFASSQGEEPIEFTIGDGTLLPGIEKAVQGMKLGEKKVIQLDPQEGYGERQEGLILEVSRTKFPTDFEPQVGLELHVPQPDGTYAIFTILEVGKEKVKLDANHPLAGENLTFELELLEIV